MVAAARTGLRERIRGVFAPNVTVAVPPKEPEDLLEAALEVLQTQILAQLSEETSIDGQTMGWLAFLGALLAVDVAAKDLLHKWWWTPLVGVGLALVPCLYSFFASAPKLGPRIVPFYDKYGGGESKVVRTQLMADLYASFRKNGARVRGKRIRLRIAVAITIAGLVVAALMITLDTPTRMAGHGKTTPQRYPDATSAITAAGTGAGAINGTHGHNERLGRIAVLVP